MSMMERLDIGQDYTFFPLCNMIPLETAVTLRVTLLVQE